MNYHNITHDDMLNGEGLRVVLWVAGCSHHCEGCQNPITWDANSGVPFGLAEVEEIETELCKDYVSGITFSGGDPLNENNIVDITTLAHIIKMRHSDKDIWLYSGYKWETVKDWEIFDYVDVFVDGKFQQENADINYKWAGSTNQRVIDVKESKLRNEVVLYDNN